MVYTPTATYRLQLSHEFNFSQLEKIIPYLEKLGISTLYFAPVFTAREGSTHGYDVTDPQQLNPSIGEEEQWKKIHQLLQEKGMGCIQDIVPNHMAYGSRNRWLMDVLEKGPFSPYFDYFDLWNDIRGQEPFMTPFLGDSLESCLQKGEIKILLQEDRCFVAYYDNLYPLSLPAYSSLLESAGTPETEKAYSLAKVLQDKHDPATVQDLMTALKQASSSMGSLLDKINKDPEKLNKILDSQYYRLCWWKETERKINYRRFFTVNDLICLNIQLPEVFNDYHSYIKELVAKGYIQGLRVDHIDGLYDPARYLHDLRKLVGPDVYLLVEKILEQEESINHNWPIEGTTGYDFLSQLNALFVYPAASSSFTELYKNFKTEKEWEEMVWDNKKLILLERMRGELHNLLQLYYQLGFHSQNLKEEQIEEALSCLLLSFPVYRTYISSFPVSETDRQVLEETFAKAGKKVSETARPALQHLKELFSSEENGQNDQERLQWIRRIQQISGPLEAKGLEDTTFYLYNRLSSLNEVGGQPQHFGLDSSSFHRKMKERQEKFPHTLNSTATHDTKRGEDARQRLNALSEMADYWQKTVLEWKKQNEQKKGAANDRAAPEPNDEYFIYQSLLAFYPADGKHDQEFLERMDQYVEKALREGKRNSTWSSPNSPYEEGCRQFIRTLLKDTSFMDTFLPLVGMVARTGLYKSLSQLMIKIFAPGIPDIYQGTELPDLSMVDPDNRRKVNYEQREQFLRQLLEAGEKEEKALLKKEMKELTDAKIKLFLTHKFLVFRKEHPVLFSQGNYIPVQVEGKHNDKLLAFIRNHQNEFCLVVAPLYPSLVAGGMTYFPTKADWEDTALVLDMKDLPENWTNGLSGEPHRLNSGKLAVGDVLEQFPLAYLEGGTR